MQLCLSLTSQMRCISPHEHLYSEPINDFAASTPDARMSTPQAFTAHSPGVICSEQSAVVLERTYSMPLTLQLSPDMGGLTRSPFAPVAASGVSGVCASTAPAVSKSAPASSGVDAPIVATVRQLVDNRGAVLESRETGVSLTVPPGALPASEPRELPSASFLFDTCTRFISHDHEHRVAASSCF